MASISSLSGSSSSSIYGTRNVLSGLASGLDTESMIENAVSGYQLKLTQLQQKKTKVEWKQEAYRSMITKLVGFSQKYTSYTSGTNLLSASFFNNATKVTSLGKNASKVSATGRTNSNVKINNVSKLARAAKYTVSAKEKLGTNSTASEAVDIKGTTEVGKLNGTLTLSYGSKSVSVSFDKGDVFTDAQEMADAINKKLEDEVIAFDSGSQEKASERIRAVASEDGTSISFEKVKEGDSNTVKISRASSSVGSALDIGTIDKDDTVTSFAFDENAVTEKKTRVDILSEEGFTITYNGKSYTVKGPTTEELKKVNQDGTWTANDYTDLLQQKINATVGENTLTVSNAAGGGDMLQLSFGLATYTEGGEVKEYDSTASFSVTTAADKAMKMEGGLSNKLNTSRKLSEIVAFKDDWKAIDEKTGKPIVNSDGKTEYKFQINNDSYVTVTEDTTIQELMDKLNGEEDSAVKMNYSSFTDQITFTTKDTGANQEIKFSGLSEALFDSTALKDENGNIKTDAEGNAIYAHGTDAEFEVEVDGVTKSIARSSNTIDIDGLTVTLKDTFEKTDEDYEAVTFSVSSDADKIVDAIKSMVADYNAMMTEIKDAYSTLPLTDSKGNAYMPLTDEDQADMSESAVASYEKKAKTGLLFGDRDLSNLYNNMTEALRAFGISGNDGTGIGITTSYSNGTTTLVVDENALRSALESDPDKVRDVFVGKNGNDGVMQKLKNQLDTYAGTTGASKGILVEKAGSTLAPTSIYQNTLQKEIDNYEDEIESWQDKISDKIDYYNKKFTTLEKLIAQMNNQSSMLGGLSGGY